MKTQTACEKIYGYYPGCSLHATAKEFDASLQAVFQVLGIGLKPVSGWSCCGASSAHSLSHNLAVGLAARNLALIAQSGLETIAPCAACFNRLRSAQLELNASPDRYAWLAAVLDGPLNGSARLRSPIEVLLHDIGVERIAAQVRRPLEGLRVACYYGCLLARPPAVSVFENPEHPAELDRLMEALGADPRPWSAGVDCCGGALSIARPGLARRMTQALIANAREADADLIVSACPLCQVNLELRQEEVAGRRMPALYFSEAMGLAFDLPQCRSWLGLHLIDPRPVLRQTGYEHGTA
jgi:heterodisulfide reductase subunit B